MASKINLSPPPQKLRLLSILRWRFFCYSLFFLPLFAGVYLVSLSFLVLQSSRWEKESWLHDVCCILNVMSLLSFFDSSLRWHGLVCSMWLWHFLAILTYFSNSSKQIQHRIEHIWKKLLSKLLSSKLAPKVVSFYCFIWKRCWASPFFCLWHFWCHVSC